MDRKFVRLVALVAMLALVAALGVGCAQKADTPTTPTTPTTPKSDIKAAMVTDVGGLGDKSFNDSANQGMERAKKELGVEISVLESREQTDYESNIEQLVSAGYSPVFAVGFLMTDTVIKVAPTYPGTQFGGIDEFFDPAIPNAVGLNFNEHEASYLAGIVAGLATTDSTVSDKINADNVIGFVGGMEVPLIKKFEAGFVAGVKSVNPSAKIIPLYAGNFTDQAKGKELGLQLIAQKADVIFAAAGAVGNGTVVACQEKGALFIGVDQDQYTTIPGSGDVMLTSVVKRVDVAVFEAIKAAVDGTFAGGTNKFFGLKEGGVDIAPFHDFESKIPQSITDAVASARAGIIDGSIKVPEK